MKYLFLLLSLLPLTRAAAQDYDKYARLFYGYGVTGGRFSYWDGVGTAATLPTPAYGVDAGFQISRTLYIYTGVSLFQNGYRVKDYPMPDFGHPAIAPDTGTVDYRLHQFMVPLGLRYQQHIGKKLFTGIQGGIAASQVYLVTLESQFRRGDPKGYAWYMDNYPYKGFFLQGLLRADAGFLVNDQLFLSAGCSYNYTLLNTRDHWGGNKVHFYTFAFDAGVGIRFISVKKKEAGK